MRSLDKGFQDKQLQYFHYYASTNTAKYLPIFMYNKAFSQQEYRTI